MKRWINLILVIIAGTVLASCTSKKDPRFDLIEQTIKSEQFRDFFDGSRVIFIVPNAGCEGCITTAERFVKENAILTPEIRTVFTGSTSKKSLRLKLGDDTYSHAITGKSHSNIFRWLYVFSDMIGVF